MKLSQYQIEANRTCPSLGNEAINLAHMVLGICSEQEEFLKALVHEDDVNVQEEISDMFWYIANYCTIRNYNLQELWDNKYDIIIENWEEEVDIFDLFLSRLQDLVKKNLAYKKEIKKDIEQNTLSGLLFSIDGIMDTHNVNLEQGLQNNIDKLRVRFPEKFTIENAINRNLDAERKELEK